MNNILNLIAYKDGIYTELKNVGPTILDFGFIHSDATYDVCKVLDGKIVWLDDHIQRFTESKQYFHLNVDEDYRKIIDNLLVKNNLKDAFKIAHPTIFLSQKVAKNFRYNTKYTIAADLDLILRLIKRKANYKHLNFFSVIMETGGMSSFKGKFLKKICEDLSINKKYFKYYFLNFFIQKILKIKTFLFCKKNFLLT